VLVVLFVAFVVVASAVAYLSLTQTLGSNDSCLGAPFLGSPQAGAQTTIVNVSLVPYGGVELANFRASVWVNDVQVGEMNPLADGGTAGPMRFEDRDRNGSLSSGDRFVVDTSPESHYRLDLYFESCSIPTRQSWTT